MTVVAVEIRELESVTSAFGADAAGGALRAVVDRLSTCIRTASLVARIGDGIIGILVRGNDFDSSVITDSFLESFSVGDMTFALSACIGVVPVSDHFTDPESIMRAASSALAAARGTWGGNTANYRAELCDSARERVTLQSQLRTALRNREPEIHLQPKIDIASGTIVGAEALSRWTCNGSFISPGKFVPIAESCDLTRELLDLGLEKVGAWIARRNPGLPRVPVAVNLSMLDVGKPNFAISLLEKLDELGLGPDRIEFEVTESGLMRDPHHSIQQLTTLRDHGFEIAVDDFGTGQSSLCYLERLPIDTLKIDRVFVQNLTRVTARRSIAETAIRLARNIGCTVVAEGIETLAQHQALITLDCGVCQGFFYARPMHIDEFDDFMENWTMPVRSDGVARKLMAA